MVCLYCRHETEVVNSRKRSRLPSVWRRRACKHCVAQFSTIEIPDFTTSLSVIKAKDEVEPFFRDMLFLSLHKSLGHRPDSIGNATALTETVIARLLKARRSGRGMIELKELSKASYDVLRRFDKAAAASFLAYHKDSLR